MIKRLLTLMALSSALLVGDCMPVTGDRILARDLALADPAFAALPATTIVSYAPPPGTKRVFAVPELVRIARANRVSLAKPVEICFEFPMRLMREQEVIDSMRRTLPPEAELTIVEIPKTAIPDGALEFPRTGLEPAIRGAQLWRGYVRYGETLRSPVWARITLQRHFRAV
ncbi:MAG TPA: hypothetical protein VHB50_24135, partial [Bryobacteraceae bacterium]|nr:hypothetical protein [Bryobacteraceae bacterium]